MIRFEPIRVGTGHDEEGVLAFFDDQLVAVLTHLGPDNEVAPGHWFVEHAFFLVGSSSENPVFADLDAAGAWLAEAWRGAAG